MRNLYLLLLSFMPFSVIAQETFWTEDFGFGCNSGTLADNFFSINGPWIITSTGTNAEGANTWFVSAEENGNAEGECGSACGDDPSLHLGAWESFLGTDIGAAYYEGLDGFCDFIPCGSTDKRAESPAINCSGMSSIVVDFLYMEGGNAIDNATFWFNDGTTWSQVSDPEKTALTCDPQGIWTAYSVGLPVSANNNPNVRIAFRWINNDDGEATDPSFAVDDITLTGTFGDDVMAPEITCPGDVTVFTDEFCAVLQDYTIDAIVVDDVSPFPMVVQTPDVGMDTPPGDYLITLTATDDAGNSSDCSFVVTVIDEIAPEIECPSDITVMASPDATTADITVPVPDVTENCGSYTVSNDYTGTGDASGTYPVGSTVVTFTANDDYGNSSSCSFTVTVNEPPIDCCLGDFNCDGFISVLDLIIIIPQFGCASACTTDLNDDGIITVTDIQIFTSLYGGICP